MPDPVSPQSTTSTDPTQDAANLATREGARQEAPDAQKQADNVYEKAFDRFLSNDAPSDPNDAGSPDDVEPEGEAQRDDEADRNDEKIGGDGQLNNDQVQLLKRMHMTPEMIRGWTDKQQEEFLANAAKREADQTRTFKELKAKAQPDPPDPPDPDKEKASREERETGKGGEEGEAGGEPSAFAKQARKVADDAAEVFGDEIKPLGESHVKLASTVDQLVGQLEAQKASSEFKDRLMVEMAIDSGIRELASEYPSLSKAQAREKVEQRFKNDWPASSHAQGQGPLLSRIRDAMRDAAKAEFGATSESAAQVALANKTKERLRNQPQAGQGKGRQAPVTQDDAYAQAFEKHLKSEL